VVGVGSSNLLAPTKFLKDNPAFSSLSRGNSLEVLGNAGIFWQFFGDFSEFYQLFTNSTDNRAAIPVNVRNKKPRAAIGMPAHPLPSISIQKKLHIYTRAKIS
jgi:hypothetical protein